MMSTIFTILLCIAVCSHAFTLTSRITKKSSSISMFDPSSGPIPIEMLKKRGSAFPEYVVEQQNGARAIIRTYGGNVFTYKTKDGIEVMGRRADSLDPREDTKPYSGGAPHCFPQFGSGTLPQHGFLRSMKFIQEERAKKLSFDRMIYKVVDTDETRAIWPYKFEYRFDITIRDESLEWEVIVINLDEKTFDVTMGLHNYFDISSLKNIVISGNFAGAKTLDRITGKEGVGTSNDITISQATDTLYYGVKGPITIKDSGKKTKVTLTRKGYSDTVIWSPYGNDAMGFDKFICVEPVQATPVTIPVGKFKETHFSQTVTCEKI